MIYFAIYPPATKHPDEWTIYKLRLNKCLHKDSLLLKLINLHNLAHAASFLPAFLHTEITWSSKLRILPISIPSTFCFALFQLFSYPILTQTFSYLCPKTKRWHLPLLSFMLLISIAVHLLKKGRALIFWSDCLDHCRKRETMCHLQNYKLL